MRNIANEAFSNPKRFWSYYSFKNKSKPVPDNIKYKGVSIGDDFERAEAFNDYFKSIYKDHSCCSLPDLSPFSTRRLFRAKRLFPLSASLITLANAMPTKEKVEAT